MRAWRIEVSLVRGWAKEASQEQQGQWTHQSQALGKARGRGLGEALGCTPGKVQQEQEGWTNELTVDGRKQHQREHAWTGPSTLRALAGAV